MIDEELKPVVAQKLFHAYDDDGVYVADYVATPKQFAEIAEIEGLVAGVKPTPVITKDMVNAERESRILAGFMFEGHLFQADAGSIRNINGATTGALVAKGSGVDGTDVNWSAGGGEFSWVATDNVLIPMSPDMVIAFGMTALAHIDAHIKAGRVLKDSLQADYADHKYWPKVGAQDAI